MSTNEFIIPAQVRNQYLLRRLSDLVRMQEAVKVGDYAVLERIGHNWKGNGITFGFPEIGIWGEQIESASKLQKIDGITCHLEEINKFLSKTYPVK